ncbi:MAG: DUF2085 domain-containing protein [Candidatus Bathyarchaeota archaeon]|nr:MAG: DUF2085 domain-containing protein [Candidatus Bathyarchaeota archaeon]
MIPLEEFFINLFNTIGQAFCHQMPDRTLLIGGRYLPVCARDTGAYLGLYVGYLLLPLRRKKGCGPPNLWMTTLMVTPMIIDGVTQALGFRTSTNDLRLVTGCLFGAALSPFLVYLISIVPLSRKLPVINNFLPPSVRLDERESWLSPQALSLGLCTAIALALTINSTVGSEDPTIYWLLSSLTTSSIVLHIIVLPVFLAFSLLSYLKAIRSTRKAKCFP